MKFFTSDIHFCDIGTIVCDNRSFKSAKSYDKYVVKHFNKTAKKCDTIYVVGDLFKCDGPNSFEWVEGLKLIKKINADIVLVMGNNEQRIVKYFFNNDFDAFAEHCKKFGIKEVCKTLDVEIGGKKFHLVHQIKDGDKRKINLFDKKNLESKKIIKEAKEKIKLEKKNIRDRKLEEFRKTKFYKTFSKIFSFVKVDRDTYTFSEVLVVTLLSLVIGAFSCFSVMTIISGGRNYFKLSNELAKFVEVYDTIVENYNGELDKEE